MLTKTFSRSHQFCPLQLLSQITYVIFTNSLFTSNKR